MVMNAKETKIVQDRVLWNMDETLYLFLQIHFFPLLFHSQTETHSDLWADLERSLTADAPKYPPPIIKTHPSSQGKLINTRSHH